MSSTPPQQVRRLRYEFVLGALASCGAVTVSNPMEVAKTRLQLQGELQQRGLYARYYRGLWHTLFTLARYEGLRGLQRGLSLAYPYTILMNGTRLGLYEHNKNFFGSIFGVSKDAFVVGVVSGMLSGIIGSCIANPFYIAKTRLQSYSPHLPVGHQHNYRGALHAFSSIYQEEGIKGLFRGTRAACIRISVASPVQLVSYDIAKRRVLSWGVKDGLAVHIGSSIISSAALALALNPFDVITTRLYNQKVENGKGSLYRGWADCAFKTFKTEGVYGLYKGLMPHYARLAPHTILIFVLLEQLRRLANKWNIY